MKVADLGEFGVIDRLANLIRSRRKKDADAFGFRLLVDAGDDAAAWLGPNATHLFTTDTMVDGVHFTTAHSGWRDVGWKAMAANVSDVAAMGGLPLYALVTLGLPKDFGTRAIDSLYAGMLDLAEECRFSLIGGDLVRSPVIFITVALVGATGETPLRRDEAVPGDHVAVTGCLGSPAAGLELLRRGAEAAGPDAATLVQAHRRPSPHLSQGRALAGAGIKAAMDVSDGLTDDLSKLCRASGVSARVDAHRVPVDPALKRAFPHSWRDLALTGGEDYVLLFTAHPKVMEGVLPQLPHPAAVIGEIRDGEPGRVSVCDAEGNELPSAGGGWDHYR